jgi:hypothetical protein
MSNNECLLNMPYFMQSGLPTTTRAFIKNGKRQAAHSLYDLSWATLKGSKEEVRNGWSRSIALSVRGKTMLTELVPPVVSSVV